MLIQRVLAVLPARFKWTIHNTIAHPLDELLFQLGFEELGGRIHDATIPPHKPGEGRG